MISRFIETPDASKKLKYMEVKGKRDKNAKETPPEERLVSI